MQEILIKKLHDFIGRNNPEVLINLQSEGKVTNYLIEKVTSVGTLLNELLAKNADPFFIEVMCLHTMTKDLRPSRFNYIAEIFKEEFQPIYQQFDDVGILQFELINMIESFNSIFESMEFSEANEENCFLRYAVTGAIHEYLENKRWN